jgi:hypothetical protein
MMDAIRMLDGVLTRMDAPMSTKSAGVLPATFLVEVVGGKVVHIRPSSPVSRPAK